MEKKGWVIIKWMPKIFIEKTRHIIQPTEVLLILISNGIGQKRKSQSQKILSRRRNISSILICMRTLEDHCNDQTTLIGGQRINGSSVRYFIRACGRKSIDGWAETAGCHRKGETALLVCGTDVDQSTRFPPITLCIYPTIWSIWCIMLYLWYIYVLLATKVKTNKTNIWSVCGAPECSTTPGLNLVRRPPWFPTDEHDPAGHHHHHHNHHHHHHYHHNYDHHRHWRLVRVLRFAASGFSFHFTPAPISSVLGRSSPRSSWSSSSSRWWCWCW